MRAQGAGYRLALDSSVRWRTQCRFAEIAPPANSYVLPLVEADESGHRRLVWRTLEDGRPVDFQQKPATTVCERMQVDTFSLLPLDELLKMATCPLRAEGGTSSQIHSTQESRLGPVFLSTIARTSELVRSANG
jgi:hypothetical protein